MDLHLIIQFEAAEILFDRFPQYLGQFQQAGAVGLEAAGEELQAVFSAGFGIVQGTVRAFEQVQIGPAVVRIKGAPGRQGAIKLLPVIFLLTRKSVPDAVEHRFGLLFSTVPDHDAELIAVQTVHDRVGGEQRLDFL